MFEQTFKTLDDVLRQEAGCTTELDYTEQTSWMLFLHKAFTGELTADSKAADRSLSEASV